MKTFYSAYKNFMILFIIQCVGAANSEAKLKDTKNICMHRDLPGYCEHWAGNKER